MGKSLQIIHEFGGLQFGQKRRSVVIFFSRLRIDVCLGAAANLSFHEELISDMTCMRSETRVCVSGETHIQRFEQCSVNSVAGKLNWLRHVKVAAQPATSPLEKTHT